MDLMSLLNEQIFGVWFLIGAALVFFMQAGFAMVEAGFTRAKNSGNIIMKNLMDFCIGTVMFIVIGFGLLCGEDALGGFLGLPTMGIFTDYANFDWSSFVFNLVFCATTATIVSGAMAERTKFSSYCVYSAVISAVVYPIEAHWIWGGGWLSQLGFHDYAGSTAIHMVGGLSALIGAAILGARIGKFTKGKDGKVQVHAFPGHNIVIGALGCFILWFGWYGFNGAAATNASELGSIFLTTTVAPSVATVTCMLFTWIKYGKPDVSMCLNASLAGLVAITAPCDVVTGGAAAVIGIVAGLLTPFGVWLLDNVLHVDDPVGAVAVHFLNGLWGTLAVGIFANPSSPGFETAGILPGLTAGGGFTQLGIQALGMVTVCAWTAVLMTIFFIIIKHTIGLRVSAEEEIGGLDIYEHGIASAYADFMPSALASSEGAVAPDAADAAPMPKAIPIVKVPKEAGGEAADADGHPITKITIVCKESKFETLKHALGEIGVTGMTVSHVLGCGMQKGKSEYYRGVAVEATLLPKIKIDIVVCRVPVQDVIETAVKTLYTGHIGDGKIFVYGVQDVIKVRTGESGYDAMTEDGENC